MSVWESLPFLGKEETLESFITSELLEEQGDL